MSITIRQLNYFVATAELGKISQAAIQLNISQSAVTSAVKELEDILAAKLFVRNAHGVELTDTGRRFLDRAYSVLAAVNEALNLPAMQSEIAGKISIAATYTMLGYFLPYHLQQLSRLYPRLDIQVHELARGELEEGLASGRYDLGVLLTSNLMMSELKSETFFSSIRRLWVSAQHPLVEHPNVGLKEVAEQPYIMLTVDEAAYTALRYWNKTPYEPNIKLRTSSVEAVRSMVANGGGVTILSDMVYRPWSLESKRIETIVLTDPVPAMSVGLAWKKGRELSPEMEAVRKYFSHVYMEPQQALQGLRKT